MRRTSVRWAPRRLVALLVILASAAALGSRGGGRGPSATPAAGRDYVVKPGDTVWAIAARIAGPHQDPRPVVDRLLAANDLRDPLIVVGERLVLPP